MWIKWPNLHFCVLIWIGLNQKVLCWGVNVYVDLVDWLGTRKEEGIVFYSVLFFAFWHLLYMPCVLWCTLFLGTINNIFACLFERG